MIIDSLGIGGAEKITLTLAKLFVQKGFNVEIICIYNHIQFPIPENINVHTISYEKRRFQNTIYKYKLQQKIAALEKAQGGTFDLILVHLLKSARLMKDYKHKNLYFILHSTMSQESLSGLSKRQYDKMLKRMRGKFNGKNLIAVSKGVADDLTTVVGIKYKSLQVIYNPIDIENINTQAMEENPFQEKKPYIVHLGRLVKVKRHDRLLRAFKASQIDAHLVLVGAGEYAQRIKNEIEELELQGRVTLAGLHTNPYPIIRDARMLVLTSDYEGLNTAILEALALKVPVVSTDCFSGPREILEGYHDNALAPLDNEEVLAQMIHEQYLHPQAIAKDILDRFDVNVIVNQYIALINNVK